MKVWVHGSIDNKNRSSTNQPAYKYFHVFTGNADHEGYVEIEKSLIEFGYPGQNFQRPGEKIFLGMRAISDNKYDLHDNVITFIIKGIFEGDFVLEGNRFKVMI